MSLINNGEGESMTDVQEPTKAQVEAANAAEKAKWEDDFDKEEITIPFSRDEKTEEKEEEKKIEEKELKIPEDIEYTDPEPVVKTEDPGDFKANDYSFTVETLDGVKTKITTPEQAEEFADANADNLSAAQQIKLVRNTTNMDSKMSKDLEKWEAQKEKFDAESSIETERQNTISNLANEIQYMITKGILTAVADEYKDADWSDPMVAKQPGVREQIELVNYMTKENNERAKSGVRPFASMMDAYNDMEREQSKSEKAEARERSDKARKAVASVSSAPSASSQGVKAPKGIAVGNPNVFKNNSSIWE